MIVILLLSFCVFSLLLYYYSIQYGRYGRLINCIPGKSGAPIIGNIINIYNCSLENIWTHLYSLCNIYYPITKFWSFTSAYVSIRHPDDIRIICNAMQKHNLKKSFEYSYFQPWLGTGIFTSEGAKWQKRRKILMPTFHFSILEHFIDTFIKEGDRMTKSLKNFKDMVVPDLLLFLGQHTLNIICETAMGTSLEDMGEFKHQYCRAVEDMSHIIVYRATNPWFYSDMLFALTSMGRKQTRALEILHGFIDKVIAKRKLYHEYTNWEYFKKFEKGTETQIDDGKIIGIRKKLAFLDLLLAESRNNNMSDLDIREEVNTIMFAGHDTTSIAMCFAILLLAEHKDIQDRVREEVNAVMQENLGKLTVKALQNLPYLERCLKESLRLYPSAPFILRNLLEDVKLQSYLIPSGTTLHINIRDVHRDPNFWPNPNVFDPDRFLADRSRMHHPYSYIPFSIGPRNCIGQRYAMIELKSLMASLVHSYYLEPVDYLKDLQFKIDIMTRVTHPIRVRFVPIKDM